MMALRGPARRPSETVERGRRHLREPVPSVHKAQVHWHRDFPGPRTADTLGSADSLSVHLPRCRT